MANYDENMKVLLGGHLNLFDDKINSQKANLPARTPNDNTADIRDILTSIVGNSYKGLTDQNIKSQYARLTNLVGLTQAQKLIDHTLIFNQRPENIKSSIEQRVQNFYNAGSQDRALNDIIKSAGGLGYGPVASLNNSADTGNQKLAGNYAELPIANNDAVINAANKKIIP